ncbi:MAG: hypothetical protein LUD72_12380 [Bacteroidales bacterium]|nr:hypothetical protein [Bacteroidales bacterium]
MIDKKLYKDLQDRIKSRLSSCTKKERPYLEMMQSDLNDASFCRIRISDRFGDDFREFQYRHECFFNAVLNAVKEELDLAEGPEQYAEIYGQLHGWKDAANALFGV